MQVGVISRHVHKQLTVLKPVNADVWHAYVIGVHLLLMVQRWQLIRKSIELSRIFTKQRNPSGKTCLVVWYVLVCLVFLPWFASRITRNIIAKHLWSVLVFYWPVDMKLLDFDYVVFFFCSLSVCCMLPYWLCAVCVCVSLCCISPVLAANVIKGCQVTIGADQGTAAAIEQMGAKHVNKNVTVSFQSDVPSPWQQFSVALVQGFMVRRRYGTQTVQVTPLRRTLASSP